jgi:hypothetical protein
MYACYGNLIRDYAFAVSSGRLTAGQIQAAYREKCINVITNCGDDNLMWSQQGAYGSSFPFTAKAYRGGGWYFSPAQAFDIVVAYQFSPRADYLDAIMLNVNYELGCNPVNVTYVTGLGSKRQRNVVDQYSANDHRGMPKTGVPISNIQVQFQYTWMYGYELFGLAYPSDYSETGPYAYYDRWCDDWNVSTEASTTDTARSYAGLAWLAAQTPTASQPWRSTNATINTPGSGAVGQPVNVSLQVADPNLTGARIVWDVKGQEPSYGTANYSFTPTQQGAHWMEAEVQWPDGRRAFAVTSINISDTTPRPQLSEPTRLSNGQFTFRLTGVPLATYITKVTTDISSGNWAPLTTNTLPASGNLVITDPGAPYYPLRYYRAFKTP